MGVGVVVGVLVVVVVPVDGGWGGVLVSPRRCVVWCVVWCVVCGVCVVCDKCGCVYLCEVRS